MAFTTIKLAMGVLVGFFRQGPARVRVNSECPGNFILRDWLAVISQSVRLFPGFVMRARKQTAVFLR